MLWFRRAAGLVLVALVIGGVVVATLGFTRGGISRATAGLVLAISGLTLTVMKTGYDIFLSPEVEARRQRRLRAEIRRENLAGSIRQLLGLKGSLLVADIGHAWESRNWVWLETACRDLTLNATEAYHLAESMNDVAEIHIGVVMVEAEEVADRCSEWVDRSPTEQELAAVGQKVKLVEERVKEVQKWAHAVLGEALRV